MSVSQPDKTKTAIALLRGYKGRRTILFSRTKRGADRIAKRLCANGLSAQAIHGNKSQGQRTRALEAFRVGETDILVATDVAARGIDIPDVELVLNFDLPEVAESYVHRIGRTGRAGKSGTAIAFCNDDEVKLLRAIEKILGNRIPAHDDGGAPKKGSASVKSEDAQVERTYDHTKSKGRGEVYKPEQHAGWPGRGGSGKAGPNKRRRRRKPGGDAGANSQTDGPKRQGSNRDQLPKPENQGGGKQSADKKPNRKRPQQDAPRKATSSAKRKNRPGSRARKRHRANIKGRG